MTMLNPALAVLNPALTVLLPQSLLVEVPSALTAVQLAGEAALGSGVAVAAAQGALVMHQYAHNPRGELIAPPGPTVGVEDCSRGGEEEEEESVGLGLLKDGGCDPIAPGGDQGASGAERSSDASSQQQKDLFYKINRGLPLLLPLMAGQGSLAILRYSHLLHLGAILAAANLYDFFQRVPGTLSEDSELPDDEEETGLGDQPNIVVIGDSMAVGIGCLNIFDPEKDSSIIKKTENVNLRKETNLSGPVFPMQLARTLSRRLGKPVHWRSGGVDGGDTTDIRENLLSII